MLVYEHLFLSPVILCGQADPTPRFSAPLGMRHCRHHWAAEKVTTLHGPRAPGPRPPPPRGPWDRDHATGAGGAHGFNLNQICPSPPKHSFIHSFGLHSATLTKNLLCALGPLPSHCLQCDVHTAGLAQPGPAHLLPSSLNTLWPPFCFWHSPSCLPPQALGPAVSPAQDTSCSAPGGCVPRSSPKRLPVNVLWKAAHLPITMGTSSIALAIHGRELCKWRCSLVYCQSSVRRLYF